VSGSDRQQPRLGSAIGWAAAACTLVLTAWLQPYFVELRSPNPLVRIYLTRALVDDGTVTTDGPVGRYGGLSDQARRDGHYYCDKAPGVSLMATPIYAAMRLFASAEQISNRLLLAVARIFLCALPAAACLLLVDLWLLALGVAARRRAAALAALGGGSLLLPYSLELFGHAPAAFLVTLCGYLCLGPVRVDGSLRIERVEGGARIFAAGLIAGLAVLTEYPTLMLVGTLLAAALWRAEGRPRFAALVALGGLGPAIVFLGYNQLAFGGPFTTGYAFVESAYFRNIHAQGFMGLAAPQLEAFAASFFSPARGLFFVAPWTLAAPVGALLLWRRDRSTAVALLACAVIYTFFVSSFRYWIGGWAIGQRHLTPLMPLAALGFGVALEAVFRKHSSVHRSGRLVPGGAHLHHAHRRQRREHQPTFAEEFRNPLFELTLRLWRLELHPYTLGSLAGLSSRVGIALPALAALALVLFCLRAAAAPWLPAPVDGTRRLLAALLCGVWFSLAPLAGQGDADSEHRFEWIVDTVWEPRDHLPAKRPDPVKTLPDLERRPPAEAAMLRHLARHLAASGDTARALELMGRAMLQEQERP